MLLILLYYY